MDSNYTQMVNYFIIIEHYESGLGCDKFLKMVSFNFAAYRLDIRPHQVDV